MNLSCYCLSNTPGFVEIKLSMHDYCFQKGYFKRLAKVFEDALKPPSKSSGFEPEVTPKSSGNGSPSQGSSNGSNSKTASGGFVGRAGTSKDSAAGDSNAASNGAGSSNGNKVSSNGDALNEEAESAANGHGTDAEKKMENDTGQLSLEEQVNVQCMGVWSTI